MNDALREAKTLALPAPRGLEEGIWAGEDLVVKPLKQRRKSLDFYGFAPKA
jgi:hypothetical protein